MKLRWDFAVFDCCSLIILSICTDIFLNIVFSKVLRNYQKNVRDNTVGKTGGRLGKDEMGRTFFIPSYF